MAVTRPFARLVRAAIAALLLALAPGPARAEALRVKLSHEIYWLGFPVLDLTTTAALDGGRYALSSTERTLGLLDLVVDFSSRQEVRGAIASGDIRPTTYRQEARWRGEDREVRLDFGANGPAHAEVVPPPEEDDRDPVPAALQAGTVDPLSAAVLLGAISAGDQPCRKSVAIFDGRQRYNLRLDYEGTATLPKNADAAFGGEAIECRVTIERVAGFMKRYLAQPPRPPSTLWLARYAGGRLLIPVKLETETRWGTLTGYLIAIAIDGAD